MVGIVDTSKAFESNDIRIKDLYIYKSRNGWMIDATGEIEKLHIPAITGSSFYYHTSTSENFVDEIKVRWCQDNQLSFHLMHATQCIQWASQNFDLSNQSFKIPTGYTYCFEKKADAASFLMFWGGTAFDHSIRNDQQ